MKYIILRRNKLIFIFTVCFLVILISVININQDVMTTITNNRRIPIYSVEIEERKIALTFDVAWGNSDLDDILGILSRYNAKATFFVTGAWVRKFPEDIKRMSEQGHDVENHSDTHPHIANISSENLKEDTIAANDSIYEILGTKTRFYRAPYGEYNNDILRVIEDELGLKFIQWDVDSLDYKPAATVYSIKQNVMNKVRNGSITLFHVDTKSQLTAPALDLILANLSEQRYSFVLLDDLLIQDNYYIDHTGRQFRQ